MFTIFSYTRWKWSDLPSAYFHNEYLSADPEALTNSAVSVDEDCDDGGDGCQLPSTEDSSDTTEYSLKLPKHKVSAVRRSVFI